jgi:hypothetical protein
MFDEQRLGNDGTEASRPCKPDDGDNQMKEKDDDIAPPAMVSKPEKTPNFGQFSNSPWTGTLFLLAMAYRMVDGIAGSYIAARLAPRRPMQHSLILGAVGIVLSSIGAVVTWNKGSNSFKKRERGNPERHSGSPRDCRLNGVKRH